MNLTFDTSPVTEQWLYRHDTRTVFVWEDDLTQESLSYIVVVLAHELGHAVDFTKNPQNWMKAITTHWSEVPDDIEIAAFVHGFNVLKQLYIPVSLEQYVLMIDPSIAHTVQKEIETRCMCCLLSFGRPFAPQVPGSSDTAS